MDNNSLRKTIIGGIVSGIAVILIAKYFINNEGNIQPKTNNMQHTVITENNPENKIKRENTSKTNVQQNISPNTKNSDGKGYSEKQNSTNSQPTQLTENVSQTSIAIPKPLHPDNYAAFSYPRHVLLQWSKVPNAVNYKVQIEIFVLQTKEWKDLNKFFRGGTTKYFDDIVRGGTSLYFTGVGAQPHRWRVKAIGKDGRGSKYSEWRYIKFDN